MGTVNPGQSEASPSLLDNEAIADGHGFSGGVFAKTVFADGERPRRREAPEFRPVCREEAGSDTCAVGRVDVDGQSVRRLVREMNIGHDVETPGPIFPTRIATV